MAIDAHAILVALQDAGLPVTGLVLLDPLDPTTWRFQPASLSVEAHAQAIQLVLALLNPPPVVIVPGPSASTGPTLDQVIAWQAGKLGISEAQARLELDAFPRVYAPAVARLPG